MLISDTGTTTHGISVARTFRRNTNTTRITSRTEITSVRSTSCRDARITGVRSTMSDSVMLPGMEAWSWGSTALIRSAVSMMFAPGCRLMMMRTAGVPFAIPIVRRSSTEWSTVATSDNRTARPR